MKYQYSFVSILFLAGCLWNDETLSYDLLKIKPPEAQASSAQSSIPIVAPQALFERQGPREFYEWAAESGYAQAEEVMGLLYLYDKPQDVVMGEDYLIRAYQKKSITAGIELARLYSEGEMIHADYDKAMEYLSLGIEHKNLQALKLAYVIESLKQNKAKAIMYLEQAAELGDPDAKEQLAKSLIMDKNGSWQRAQQLSAEAHDEGLYQELDDLRDFWPQNAPAIKPQAQRTILHEQQQSLLKLPHVPKFFPRAFFEEFRKAASKGSPYAAYQEALQRLNAPMETKIITKEQGDLLTLLNKAQNSIVPAKVLKARLILRNYWPQLKVSDAVALLKSAAEEDDPYALFALSLFARQSGNYDHSADYYKKAMLLPNHAEAQFDVAEDLIKGYYPFWDNKAAYDWIAELAQQDFNPALLLLADLKEQKEIAAQTDEEIFLHRLRAAWQGSLRGQYLVGNMYLKGQAVKANPVKAFRWFNVAARGGYRPAQLQVGLMYEQGQGIIQSLPKAYAWQKLAAHYLYEGSEESLHKIVLAMTQSELQEALRLETLFRENYC